MNGMSEEVSKVVAHRSEEVYNLLLFCFDFEIRSHYVALLGLEFAM